MHALAASLLELGDGEDIERHTAPELATAA
jgi:hypothetical protein